MPVAICWWNEAIVAATHVRLCSRSYVKERKKKSSVTFLIFVGKYLKLTQVIHTKLFIKLPIPVNFELPIFKGASYLWLFVRIILNR